MKALKATRKANKKELKAIAKFLANDYLTSVIPVKQTFDELYKENLDYLKELTALTYKLPKTKGKLVVIINVYDETNQKNGVFHTKFVSEYLVTKDSVEDYSDFDYIADKGFIEDELPEGAQMLD